MNENLKKLLEALGQNEEAIKQVKENPPKTKEALLALAAQLGCPLTADDLVVGKAELTEKELDAVAGGSKFDDIVEEEGWGMAILCVIAMAIGAEW